MYYNPQTAEFLAQVSSLTYIQYANSLNNPQYNGSIIPPAGFRQIASFTAPELYFTNEKAPQTLKGNLARLLPDQVDLTNPGQLDQLTAGLTRVYFGFVLEDIYGSGQSIFAFRGTQNPYEWLMDAAYIQVPVPRGWFKDSIFKLAKSHFGFLFLYAFLIRQVREAAQKLANPKVSYVTGHSLGGALSVLGALTLGMMFCPLGDRTGKIQMYGYAGPRVGDPVFAEAYNYLLPYSYRVINLSDLVPLLPPENINGYTFQHIGGAEQEWSFLNQTGNVGQNHDIQTYCTALGLPGVVTNAERNYPCSGF